MGFPGGISGKEPSCQYRRCKRRGFGPWVGKIPWRRAWQPTLVFLPGDSHGQGSLVDYSPQGSPVHGSLVGYSPWGHEESYTTEAT